MLNVLSVAVVVLVGLMVGVELAVAVFVNPMLERLPADGLLARSDGARVLGRVMPVWYLGSMALAAAWAVAVWGHATTWAVVVGAGLLATSVLMSVTLLVPINSRVARWSAGGAPADWREQLGRWDRFHLLRVAVIVAAFVLLAAASAV